MNRTGRRPGIDHEQIVALYAAGHSTEQIARQLGIGATTARRAIKAAGVPVRSWWDYPALAGPDHPAWKGGIHENYYRRAAFAHYGRRCLRCGATGRLDVHHRSRDRGDNRVENLEPLCRPCHRAEHDGDRWIETVVKELERHATPQRRKRGLPRTFHCPTNVLRAGTPRNGPYAAGVVPASLTLYRGGLYELTWRDDLPLREAA
jgi:hypothetical protein